MKKEFLTKKVRLLCGRPSPMKRLIMVLAACVLFAAINVYFVISSIYNMGKSDARKELPQIEHIEGVKIHKNDSINLLKHKLYEFE